MDTENLRRELETLHRDLAAVEDLDEEGRRLLLALQTDIEDLLARSEAESSDEQETLAERLRELVSRFEEDHPKLAAAMGGLADQLSRMGI